jgi:DNA-directed RNA polymerase subunit RPC12/RpoP
MSITTNCPNCEREYKLADTQEGKTVRCKDCGEKFVVEAPRRPRAEDEEDDHRPRRRSARARDDEEEEERVSTVPTRARRGPARARDDEEEEERPRRRSSPDRDEEEEEERPRRRPTKKGGVPLWAWLAGGGGLLVVVVGVVVLVVVLRKGDKGGGSAGPGGAPGGASKVTAKNGDSLLEGMTVKEAEDILGPGKVCSLDEILKVCETEGGTGGPRGGRLHDPARAGTESSWRLWQNDGVSVMVSFRKGNSGIERVSTVLRLTRLPGGGIASMRRAMLYPDLDAVAAEREKKRATLKDPRWKTGPAIRTALVGKWRSPKKVGFRQGWDFNGDGKCVAYQGFYGNLPGQDNLNVDRRGEYRFLDDEHVEIVTTIPNLGFPGQPPAQRTERYKVLVDDKELVFVDEHPTEPAPQPALQRER